MKAYYLLILIIVFVVGCTAQPQNNNNANGADLVNVTNDIQPDNVNTDNLNLPLIEGVSLSELNKHNSKSDCWVSYQGKVYDVTKFLPFHPGGADAIAKYCGTASEFEQGFTAKHNTTKVSVLLQQIYKGDLI